MIVQATGGVTEVEMYDDEIMDMRSGEIWAIKDERNCKTKGRPLVVNLWWMNKNTTN